MPHENINGTDEGFPYAWRVQVIWKPSTPEHAYTEDINGYVQLLTENRRSTARFPKEPSPSDPKAKVKETEMQSMSESEWQQQHPIIEIGDPEFDQGPPDFEAGQLCRGFAVMLDRDGINRLIRMLRKARDQAFGTDA